MRKSSGSCFVDGRRRQLTIRTNCQPTNPIIITFISDMITVFLIAGHRLLQKVQTAGDLKKIRSKLLRTQKHYPAPLAIPLPNYSYDGKELERQVKLKKSEKTQVNLQRNILEVAAGDWFSTFVL